MRPTHALNLLFVALVVAAFIVPRVLPHDTGLAGSTSAAVTGIGLLLAAGAVALVQLASTWRHWRGLPRRERFLGVAPLLVLAVICVAILVALPRH